MMPDGDTAALLREQVGGLFFAIDVLGKQLGLTSALTRSGHAVAVASCPFLTQLGHWP